MPVERELPDCCLPRGIETLRYRLVRSSIERFRVSVGPGPSVEVRAPLKATDENVAARLARRAKWLRKQLRHFSAFPPPIPPRQYVSGETHIYLGRQYRLRVLKAQTECVRLKGKFLVVRTPHPKDTTAVRRAVESWYGNHARRYITGKVDHWLGQTCFHRTQCPAIRFARMQRRWGSCSAAGTITLNTDLIKVPSHCIDYVVVHELCHLKCAHHGRPFDRLLNRCMPDWRAAKARLDAFVLSLE